MAKDKEIEDKTPKDVADEKARKKATKAYDETMPEPDTTFGDFGRKAAGVAAAIPAGIAGAAILGPQPGSPGFIDSAKFGAKSTYNAVTGNKKAGKEAEDEYLQAAKRDQSVKTKRNTGENTNAAGDSYAKGGTASSRADGIAQRGKTRGTFIACGGGMMK
jgi:hypothetical protein